MGHQQKLGPYGKNRIFGPKTEILGPKNAYTFGDSPCSGHDRKKLFKEKKCLCPNNQGGKCHFGWFFGVQPIFRLKTTFRPKNARFSVILARTRFVVLLGHFLMARTVPPSFVEIGPKLRVVALLKWEWPKTAKNRGEPQKMTPSSETEIFLGVVPMGKL